MSRATRKTCRAAAPVRTWLAVAELKSSETPPAFPVLALCPDAVPPSSGAQWEHQRWQAVQVSLRDRRLTRKAGAIYVALLGDPAERPRPTAEGLAKHLRCSPRLARQALASLLMLGYLVATAGEGVTGVVLKASPAARLEAAA